MRVRDADPVWLNTTVEVIVRAVYFFVGAAFAFYWFSYFWPRIGTFTWLQVVLIWGICLAAGGLAAYWGPRILQRRTMKNRGSLEEVRTKSGLPAHSRVRRDIKKIEIPTPERKEPDPDPDTR